MLNTYIHGLFVTVLFLFTIVTKASSLNQKHLGSIAIGFNGKNATFLSSSIIDIGKSGRRSGRKKDKKW